MRTEETDYMASFFIFLLLCSTEKKINALTFHHMNHIHVFYLCSTERRLML